MGASQLSLFLSAALLLALVPGPDNLAVLGLGLARGRRAATGFALGCAAGCLNHTLLAALGVLALLRAHPAALSVLQYAGATYLVWLGWRALRSTDALAPGTATGETSGLAQFRRGLIANAINPKVGLFFLAFLPQFLDPQGPPASVQILVLGALFALCAALVFVGIAFSAAWLGDRLRRQPRLSVALTRASGLCFVALGLRLALADMGRS